MSRVLFKQSRKFIKNHIEVLNEPPRLKDCESQLLKFVVKNSERGNPTDVQNKINQFCFRNWMMNIGPEKGQLIRETAINQKTKKILEIGGYCGFSSLFFANATKQIPHSRIYSIQVSPQFAQIARKIHEHAGVANKININVGTVETSLKFLRQKGPFDLILIDHWKHLYLQDFILLENNGAIQKGTMVVADNIINPGAPDYLQMMKQKEGYNHTLYHCFKQYSNKPDAILISQKL